MKTSNGKLAYARHLSEAVHTESHVVRALLMRRKAGQIAAKVHKIDQACATYKGAWNAHNDLPAGEAAAWLKTALR